VDAQYFLEILDHFQRDIFSKWNLIEMFILFI